MVHIRRISQTTLALAAIFSLWCPIPPIELDTFVRRTGSWENGREGPCQALQAKTNFGQGAGLDSRFTSKKFPYWTYTSILQFPNPSPFVGRIIGPPLMLLNKSLFCVCLNKKDTRVTHANRHQTAFSQDGVFLHTRGFSHVALTYFLWHKVWKWRPSRNRRQADDWP